MDTERQIEKEKGKRQKARQMTNKQKHTQRKAGHTEAEIQKHLSMM